MKEKYDIVEYDHGKPLTGAIFRDVDLTLDKFKLGDVDKFYMTMLNINQS